MSYIRCFDNYSSPYYVPAKNLRGLFKDLVIQPFEDHPRTTSRYIQKLWMIKRKERIL